MADHMDSIPNYHTPNERQLAAVPELQHHQPYQPSQYSHLEDHPKQIPAEGRRDHCRRASRIQSRKEHHRTNIQSQDPQREIPAASAESLPCLHRLQEGLWQGMARSPTGNYEEIQHQCQHHTSHVKSVWQGPECSPVQWQHRRMVQNYSRSSTRVSTLTNPLEHLPRENHVWGIGWPWR